jgi:phosphate transport system substrate-binding protein
MKQINKVSLISAGLFMLSSSWAFAAGEVIKVDGSSTVFPITEAVAEEFQKQSGGVKVMVGISGTGGGFKRFCRAETDISDASRPIKEKEIKSCQELGIEFIELPVAYDGLAVMVNPENTWVDYLTVEELKKIWSPDSQGVITKWSQVRAGFPDVPLRLFGPGTDSGTFDYFTEVINGKAASSRGDYTASEDDNVLVEGIANEEGSLGYFGLAYYEQNKDRLKVVPIDDGKENNGSGAIIPTMETVKNATYQPLARPIFIYVGDEAAGKEYIRKFVQYYLTNAAPLVEEVGYIPLPDEAYAAALKKFNSGKKGTVFANAPAGSSVIDLLRK